MMGRPPLGPYAARLLTCAVLATALTIVLVANGRGPAALATGTIAAAAVLSILRQLINRENL